MPFLLPHAAPPALSCSEPPFSRHLLFSSTNLPFSPYLFIATISNNEDREEHDAAIFNQYQYSMVDHVENDETRKGVAIPPSESLPSAIAAIPVPAAAAASAAWRNVARVNAVTVLSPSPTPLSPSARAAQTHRAGTRLRTFRRGIMTAANARGAARITSNRQNTLSAHDHFTSVYATTNTAPPQRAHAQPQLRRALLYMLRSLYGHLFIDGSGLIMAARTATFCALRAQAMASGT